MIRLGSLTKKIMTTQQVNLECPKCGMVFTAFLQEMAARNAKVTCPGCGESSEYSPSQLRDVPVSESCRS